VDHRAPWKLAKDPALAGELDATLGSLVRHLARQCVLLFPFMPSKTRELWRALGAPGDLDAQRFDDLPLLDGAGWKVAKPTPLFPKDPTPAR
jgi:methionyl-tRNA synthetase